MGIKVALTGHRPARLNGHEEEIKTWLINNLSNMDCSEVYSGMAMGADQIFAQVALDMDIPLTCCYPYHRKKFHPVEEQIMAAAKDVRFINEEYSKQCYWWRDKYMVDNCDVLLAIWDGKKEGGTWLTIDYARKIGKKIIYYSKEKLA